LGDEVVLIDEWYLWAEGPSTLSAVETDRIRELVHAAVDQCCRHLETELALLRGAADVRVQAI
jgi:hypothetical protein